MSDQSNPPRGVKLNLWASGGDRRFSLAIRHGGTSRPMIVVLGKGLAAAARRGRVPFVRLDAKAQEALTAVIDAHPGLEESIERGAAIRADADAILVNDFELFPERPEQIVVLVGEPISPGRSSLVQITSDGRIVGGFSIEVRGPRAYVGLLRHQKRRE